MPTSQWVKLVCPNCGKRAFDISGIPEEELMVSLKCPNCHRLITVPCTEVFIMRRGKQKQEPDLDMST